MDERKLQITQSQGIGSRGTQILTVDNRTTHIYPQTYENLVKTHVGSITFDPNTLRDVIIAVAATYDEIEQKPTDFDSISIEKKNALNNLSQEFYSNVISRDYEPYFHELDVFLTQRASEDLQGLVGKIVRSLNKKIVVGHKGFESFEHLLMSIEEALLDSQYAYLRGKEDSISLFLFYLYANCFIGIKTEEEMQ
ncbi:MAG: ABC-three component system protein [Aeromonas popoffii]|uniref:ABC-three component system protein n=1 Tax=Aeromonas popoffii TaxID=70856 RepID=UPI003F3B306A